MTVAQVVTDNGIVGVELLYRSGEVVGIRVTKDRQAFVINYAALPKPTNPEDRVDVQEQLQAALDSTLGPSVKVFVQSLTPPIVRVR